VSDNHHGHHGNCASGGCRQLASDDAHCLAETACSAFTGGVGSLQDIQCPAWKQLAEGHWLPARQMSVRILLVGGLRSQRVH
jgi:hypothetical protein